MGQGLLLLNELASGPSPRCWCFLVEMVNVGWTRAYRIDTTLLPRETDPYGMAGRSASQIAGVLVARQRPSKPPRWVRLPLSAPFPSHRAPHAHHRLRGPGSSHGLLPDLSKTSYAMSDRIHVRVTLAEDGRTPVRELIVDGEKVATLSFHETLALAMQATSTLRFEVRDAQVPRSG